MQGSARLGRAVWKGSLSVRSCGKRWSNTVFWFILGKGGFVSLAVQAKGLVAECLQQHQLPVLSKQGMWLDYSYSSLATILESKTSLPAVGVTGSHGTWQRHPQCPSLTTPLLLLSPG